jgi:hypothetical protein
MKLHLVVHTSPEGHNYDLFVWAETRDEAIELWQATWEDVEDEIPDQVRVVPIDMPREPTVIDWGRIPEARA